MLLGILSAWGAYTNLKYEKVEPNIALALKQKASKPYLEEKILEALKVEDFDAVEMYTNLANLVGVTLSPRTLSAIAENNTFFKKSWRNTKAFSKGFLKGESNSVAEMSGSIVSDMTLYGDLRDLKVEGTKYKNGESYDKFILQISLLGIGLSATQLLSVGASTPLKVGASVMKVAKKSGKITKPFMKVVSKRLSKSVDVKVLKTAKFGDLGKTVSKSIDLAPMQVIFKDVNKIKKHTSTADTISLLKYIDNTKDLKSIGKLSKTYKTNTKGVLKVLGKGILKSGKSVLKYTSRFVAGLVGLIFSFLGILIAFVSKVWFWKTARKVIS